MGISNNIVTGVWVGCEDRSAHFQNGALGQGANGTSNLGVLYEKVCGLIVSLSIKTKVQKIQFNGESHFLF